MKCRFTNEQLKELEKHDYHWKNSFGMCYSSDGDHRIQALGTKVTFIYFCWNGEIQEWSHENFDTFEELIQNLH